MTDRDATELVSDASGGDEQASDRLMELVYTELRDMAGGLMRRERSDHTLQPTALVHDAFIRLCDQDRVNWQGRTHFKAVAAQAMHRVLVDHARSKKREKRGGGWRRIEMADAFRLAGSGPLDALVLHDAMARMAELDERQAEVARYRVYGGLTNEETSRLLGVSIRTVERDWKMAQAWLRRELSQDTRT